MTLRRSNFNIQMKKGFLELCILSILAKEEKYPSEIIEVLEKKDLIVVEGTIYPLLSRLKKERFLKYTWKESKSGPPRKYFIITEHGKMYLAELIKAWKILNKSVNQIINKKNI